MDKKKFTKKDVIYIIVIALFATGLAVSLVFNFSKKSDEKALSYYDQKVASFAVQNANLSKGQTVFLGDSITDLYPLDDYYRTLSTAAYNRGIGGDTTLGVIKRLDVSVYQLAPKNLVLMIGINDINCGREIADIAADYKTIVKSVKERLPQTAVYCVSVLPMSDKITQLVQIDLDGQNQKVESLNVYIRSVCEEYDCRYVNLNARSKDENGRLIGEYTDDGIHLNANGFSVWAQEMKAAGLN